MVKISSGVDRESEKNSSEKLRLLSPNWFMRRRLEIATMFLQHDLSIIV